MPYGGRTLLTGRTFSRAASDSITTGIGACTFTGSKTIVGIIRRASDGVTGYFIKVGAGVGTDRYMVGISSGNSLRIVEGSTVNNAPTITLVASEGIALVAVSKVGGTNKPRFHKYLFSSRTWTHEDSATTLADATATATSNTLGAEGTNFHPGDIWCLGVVNAALTDAQMEDLALGYSHWRRLLTSFHGRLHMPVAAGFKDESGNGANQTAISGTTILPEGIQGFGVDEDAWLQRPPVMPMLHVASRRV